MSSQGTRSTINGEILIDEQLCKGCGLCAKFCARGCITLPRDRLGPQGYLLPLFIQSERCNACGVCGWMCPDFAITVYQYIGDEINTGA